MKVNLIPMAGAGQRFKDAGYTTSKPLLDTDGIPMVVRAAMALPKADLYIFVCREAQLLENDLSGVLNKYFTNVLIITTNSLTEGQAITCLLAEKNIPEDAILTIGASDNDMVYDELQLGNFLLDEKTVGWIWTFRQNKLVLQDPNMYGWVKVNQENALEISCKKQISENPLNDHAIIGAFTFKKAKMFFDSVRKMIAENKRINNEFYVDIAADYVIQNFGGIKVFEVKQYICWGTPKDYEEYNNWLNYFRSRLSK